MLYFYGISANIQVIIARSVTASVHKFGGCGYDDDITELELDIFNSYNYSVFEYDSPL